MFRLVAGDGNVQNAHISLYYKDLGFAQILILLLLLFLDLCFSVFLGKIRHEICT